jgi:hypothetical protein
LAGIKIETDILKQRDKILLDKQIKNIKRVTLKNIDLIQNNLNTKLKKVILNEVEDKRDNNKSFRSLLRKSNNNKFLEDARKLDKE